MKTKKVSKDPKKALTPTHAMQGTVAGRPGRADSEMTPFECGGENPKTCKLMILGYKYRGGKRFRRYNLHPNRSVSDRGGDGRELSPPHLACG